MKIIGLALSLIVVFCPVCAEVLTGHVVGVTDGETIMVLDAERVRSSQMMRAWSSSVLFGIACAQTSPKFIDFDLFLFKHKDQDLMYSCAIS